MDPIEFSLHLSGQDPMAERPVDLIGAFDAIVRASSAAGVRIVLVGGLARNAYVRPRMTEDIDLLVRDQGDMDRLVASAERDFATPPDVQGLAALKYRKSGTAVDLMVVEYPFEREGFDAAAPRRVRRRSVPVMPIEHLCAMKVDAAADPRRPEDFGDVVRMLLSGPADAARVSELVRRDLPHRVETLEAILRTVARARSMPSVPYRRGRPRDA